MGKCGFHADRGPRYAERRTSEALKVDSYVCMYIYIHSGTVKFLESPLTFPLPVHLHLTLRKEARLVIYESIISLLINSSSPLRSFLAT